MGFIYGIKSEHLRTVQKICFTTIGLGTSLGKRNMNNEQSPHSVQHQPSCRHVIGNFGVAPSRWWPMQAVQALLEHDELRDGQGGRMYILMFLYPWSILVYTEDVSGRTERARKSMHTCI